MPLTRIHINQHVIRRNKRDGTDEPPITVKQGRMNTYCRSVEVLGPSRVVYAPCRPLSCGARVWIETDAPVRLAGVAPPPAP
jgi:hypothetical protein